MGAKTNNSASRFYGRSTVVSHFNYEICELRRRPVGSRCIEFIIRPNFLTSNSRNLRILNLIRISILYFFHLVQ
nr:hypothetical protein [Leptospira noguchii]